MTNREGDGVISKLKRFTMKSNPSFSDAYGLSGSFSSDSGVQKNTAPHTTSPLFRSDFREDHPQIFLISLKAVCKKVNRGRTSVYLLMNKDHKAFDCQFPKPVRNGRRIAFVESEINAWLAAQIRASRDAVSQ